MNTVSRQSQVMAVDREGSVNLLQCGLQVILLEGCYNVEHFYKLVAYRVRYVQPRLL